MQSLWQETKLKRFPRLEGDMETDVLIVGGGMAGILTAYFLHERGVPYVLLEKDRICTGNTGRTTAKITAQHGLIYRKLYQSGGREKAEKYLHANIAAMEKYKELCGRIDCDYGEKDNYVYAADRRKLEEEMAALERIGYPAAFCEQIPLPVEAAGAVKFPHQAQFHPLKFLAGVIEPLHIYENSWVREMIGNTAVTDGGKVKAKRVVSATHFPFINKHGAYSLKLYQHRSYVMALSHAQDVGGMYVDDDEAGLSFRNQGEWLLLGGGGSRTGRKNGNWEVLRAFTRAHYPQAEEKYRWAAQDCMSLDDLPYIGRYARSTPDFYVETGFNKWGMTGSMAAAMVISDMLCGRENDFADIFDPSRSILKPQLLVNGFEAVVNLLTPHTKVCPHLGCALKWNRAEHSWDCPCHGSRFAQDGAVLDNPANGDLPSRKG